MNSFHIIEMGEERRNNNKQLSCKLCGYRSSNRIQVLDHMTKHSGHFQQLYSTRSTGKQNTSSAAPSSNITLTTRKIKYECKVCLMLFKSSLGLNNHILELHLPQTETINTRGIYNSPGMLYICDMCNFSGNNEQALDTHTFVHHGYKKEPNKDFKKESVDSCSSVSKKGKHVCDVCLIIYTSKSMLHEHLLKCHGIDAEEDDEFPIQPKFITKTGKVKSMHICYQCGEVFKLKSQLLHHCRLTHGGRDTFIDVLQSGKPIELYRCNTCSRQFENIGYLNSHKINAHRIYSCSVCGYRAKTKYFLNKHKMDEHNPPYLCRLCDEKFQNNQTLKDHISEKHSDEFVCEVCELKFNAPVLLFEHRVTQHPSEMDKRHLCKICKQSFILRRYLLAHMAKEHKKTSGVMCDICGKCFNSASILERHQLSHSDERTILCSQCPAKYKVLWKLKQHQEVVHEKKKDYKCVECNRAFGTRTILMQHKVYVHKMITQYQCNECMKFYPCPSHLLKHTQNVHQLG